MSEMDQQEELVEALDEEFISYNEDLDPDTTCNLCQAEFLDADDLKIHLQQIHKINTLTSNLCIICSYKYTDLMNFAEHFRDKHLKSLRYCCYCVRAFTDADKLRVHEKSHKMNNKDVYKCAQCPERFSTVSELRKHDFELHNNNDDGIMLNPYFPYLSAALNIKAETVLVSLYSDTVYICVCCNYSTTNLSYFIEHARKKKCTTYVCNKCSNIYKRKDNLSRHMVKDCESVDKKGNTVMCPDCKLVVKKYELSRHKKTCKVIKCYNCGEHFKTMYELTEHQATEHPLSVELKTCNFCWKQCVGGIALQKHIDRSHKPQLHLYKYKCVKCDMPFKHPQKLFGHFFSKHKDLDPYNCKICNQKFHLRKKFTLHIKLAHNSIGFVEFDENYNVFFSKEKSENPFVPKSFYVDEVADTSKNDSQSEVATISILNNSEMSATEAEGNQAEETAPEATLKRKRTPKTVKVEIELEPVEILDSSDDEPLLTVRKRLQKSMPKAIGNRCATKKLTSINKKRFTCNICKKYCYTYQNYNNHMSLHSKKDYKKCIKCSKVFRSKEKLNAHIATEHSSSRLTETLKCMLEKRKKGESITDGLPMSERFRRTIKKVQTYNHTTSAKITEVGKDLSVQKFIESFTPEAEARPEIIINSEVTMKLVRGVAKTPAIRMTKFKSNTNPSSLKLSMPVKFKPGNMDKTVASIKLVQPVTFYNEDTVDDNEYQQLDNDISRNDSIPEVAEEVMLEETEDTPKQLKIPHKIVIPKLPTAYKDIRIAHLLPQAPFYKIVKINDVLKMQDVQKVDTPAKKEVSGTIKLPDGTKFVNTNPLAHLLGKTPIEKVLEPIKNKYYKPKSKDFQGLLAEAFSNLNKPSVKKKKKDSVVIEELSASVKETH